MKHDLSIHRADIDMPLTGMGFERFSDIVSGSLFRGTPNRSQSVVVNERDLGIDFAAFRASPTEVVQSDGPTTPKATAPTKPDLIIKYVPEIQPRTYHLIGAFAPEPCSDTRKFPSTAAFKRQRVPVG